MDFHGTLTIGWDTFIRYVRDICCSLAHHGFTRILIVNGHGSNESPLDLSARLSNVEYRELKETPIPPRRDQHDNHGQRNTAWT